MKWSILWEYICDSVVDYTCDYKEFIQNVKNMFNNINNKEVILLFKDYVNIPNVIIQSYFVRNVSLLEAMIISDGIINAIYFANEYFVYKIKERNIYRKQLVKQYNNLYRLNTIDRYLLYIILYFYHFSLDKCVYGIVRGEIVILNYSMVLMITIPGIQYYIMKNDRINRYINIYNENKKIFVYYSVSKFIINYIKDLDENIEEIKNYQIFILYKYLSFDLLYDFLKSYLFVYVLYFLRSSESTYYYYKAIKLSYYYTTGYLFNVITKDDSIYIINIIVKEKRWFDIHKVEIVHAFYSIISAKYNTNDDYYTNISVNLIKFFTLWSIICLLKLFAVFINTTLLILYLCICYKDVSISNVIKKWITGCIIYSMILLNTNDLIISLIFVCHSVIYYVLEELYFFIKNANDIKKVLLFYNKNSKKLFKTRVEKIKTDDDSTTEYVIVS